MTKDSLLDRVSKAVKTSLAKGAVAAVYAVEGMEKKVEARLAEKVPAAAKIIHDHAEPAVAAARKAAEQARDAMGTAEAPPSGEATAAAPPTTPAHLAEVPVTGRRTHADASPRRVTAPAAQAVPTLKVKRGQKHRHHR